MKIMRTTKIKFDLGVAAAQRTLNKWLRACNTLPKIALKVGFASILFQYSYKFKYFSKGGQRRPLVIGWTHAGVGWGISFLLGALMPKKYGNEAIGGDRG